MIRYIKRPSSFILLNLFKATLSTTPRFQSVETGHTR